ncbi:MAG: monofunctional biosynthetic peptidoglycan transglycosylase [Bacteroidales bacterium]|nr:monofunctional biosynthetic peptidoglycan transglycosylase [Bacteroidales bacterium]
MDDIVQQELKGPKESLYKKLIFRYGRIFLNVLKWSTFALVCHSVLVVILLSFIQPPPTPLMFIRAIEEKTENKKPVIYRKWVPIEEISPHLIDAVVASEDNLFLSHRGIDRHAIQEALEYNKNSSRIHGASTITQQTAKNLFLWPSRNWVRKGFELYFTFLIEFFWSKKRIMEVYLNVIETGTGIYGAEAAARHYFNKTAMRLTREEAALIAISLPNPRQRNPAAPTAYMISRQNTILDLMNKIGHIIFD